MAFVSCRGPPDVSCYRAVAARRESECLHTLPCLLRRQPLQITLNNTITGAWLHFAASPNLLPRAERVPYHGTTQDGCIRGGHPGLWLQPINYQKPDSATWHTNLFLHAKAEAQGIVPFLVTHTLVQNLFSSPWCCASSDFASCRRYSTPSYSIIQGTTDKQALKLKTRGLRPAFSIRWLDYSQL